MAILGAGGGGALLGELGLSTESLGLELKGREPQAMTAGSSLLTKTYALEIFATAPTRGAARGILEPSYIYFFALNPSQINFIDYSSGTTTYTAGGVVMEGGAVMLRQYTLTGRSGTARRRGYSAGEIPSSGGNAPARITADGHRLFREMHKFLKHYSDIKNDPQSSYAWSIAFHDFINDDAFIINPRQFTVDRKGAGDYNYTLTFDAVQPRRTTALSLLQRIGPFADKTLAVVSTTAGAFSGLANDIADSAGEVGGTIARSARTLNVLANELNKSVLRVRNIPTAFGDRLADAQESYAEAIEAFKTLGVDKDDRAGLALASARQSSEVADLSQAQNLLQNGQRPNADREITPVEARRAGALGVRAPQAVNDSFDPIRSNRLLQLRRKALLSEASALGLAAQELRRSRGAQPASSTQTNGELGRVLGAGATRRSFDGYPTGELVIYRGDTLMSIALRAIGDRNAAPYIAKINGLRYPYISDSGEPYTLRYGDKIVVPQFADSAPRQMLGESSDRIDERTFGRDLRLTPDGDLIATGDKTDLAVVSGVENIKQAIEIIKLRTRLGANALFPAVGIPDFIGAESAADTVAAAILGAKQCVESDPRIKSVRVEQAVDRGDGVIVALTCKTINTAEAFTAGAMVRSAL